jgi:hypothetical protein
MSEQTPPTPSGRYRYFSFDGETYTTHPTKEAARKEATDAIEFFRTEAGFDGEWLDEVARVCWGEIRECAEAIPDEASEDEEPRCDYVLTALAGASLAWLVYDPDEEGALCVVAPTWGAAWAKAAPDLGYEVDDEEAMEAHAVRVVTAEETETAWDERAELIDTIHGVLRVLRPSPNIQRPGDYDPSAELTEALDRCADLVKWGPDNPAPVIETNAVSPAVRDALTAFAAYRAKHDTSHDDALAPGRLAEASADSVANYGHPNASNETPKSRRQQILGGIVLALAEIERLDRATTKAKE